MRELFCTRCSAPFLNQGPRHYQPVSGSEGDYISQQVRKLLKDRGRSQRWLAEQLVMTERNLYARTSGITPWSSEDILQVAGVFGVDVDALLPGAPPPA